MEIVAKIFMCILMLGPVKGGTPLIAIEKKRNGKKRKVIKR